MLRPVRANCFKKDVELARKRGKDLNKLRAVMEKLIAEEPLEAWHRDHSLVGGYAGRRECHIEPDWLLIYKLESDEIILERTGTHSDLFH
jgi:mRNA interferase YafQ